MIKSRRDKVRDWWIGYRSFSKIICRLRITPEWPGSTAAATPASTQTPTLTPSTSISLTETLTTREYPLRITFELRIFIKFDIFFKREAKSRVYFVRPVYVHVCPYDSMSRFAISSLRAYRSYEPDKKGNSRSEPTVVEWCLKKDLIIIFPF